MPSLVVAENALAVALPLLVSLLAESSHGDVLDGHVSSPSLILRLEFKVISCVLLSRAMPIEAINHVLQWNFNPSFLLQFIQDKDLYGHRYLFHELNHCGCAVGCGWII